MFNFFQKKQLAKNQQTTDRESSQVSTTPSPEKPQRLSIEEQKQQRYQRKKLVIDEFGKSVINLKLMHGILTPLHIVDFQEVTLSENGDLKIFVEQAVINSSEIHKQNLRHKIYRELFNLQPGHLLLVIKEKASGEIVSFKRYKKNISQFVESLDPLRHRMMCVRYFIPPIPDDIHQYDDVVLPPKFETVLRDIINYCDLNFSLDNLILEKWEKLADSLDQMGVILNYSNQKEEESFTEILNYDGGEIDYRKTRLKLILKDSVEKRTMVIPLFIVFLSFFCSEPNTKSSFSYHFLFTATGDAKQRSMSRGDVSLPKLFNQLLDESLLPEQFNKCLSVIYNEIFRFRQSAIDDLLMQFYAHRSELANY